MATPTEMIALYIAAEQDILSYGVTTRFFGGQTLTMADLPQIRAGRQEWERREAQGSRVSAGLSHHGFSVSRFDE